MVESPCRVCSWELNCLSICYLQLLPLAQPSSCLDLPQVAKASVKIAQLLSPLGCLAPIFGSQSARKWGAKRPIEGKRVARRRWKTHKPRISVHFGTNKDSILLLFQIFQLSSAMCMKIANKTNIGRYRQRWRRRHRNESQQILKKNNSRNLIESYSVYFISALICRVSSGEEMVWWS